MIKKDISLTKILKTNVISDNPTISFVSDVYDPDFKVVNNGAVLRLEDTVEDDVFLDVTSSKKAIASLLTRNILIMFLVNFVLSLFGTVITFGNNFLPEDPNYWKYMILEFSYFSSCLMGFADLITNYYVGKRWTKKCIANAKIFNGESIYRCSFLRAKRDVMNILSKQYIRYKDERYFPYGDAYYDIVSKKVSKIDNCSSLESSYLKELSKISSSSSTLRTISTFLLSAAIQLFTFFDSYNQLKTFFTNIMIVAFLIPVVSYFLASTIIGNRFLRTYTKLDAIAFLYSYLCLEMPIGNSFSYRKSLEKCNDCESEDELDYYVQNESSIIKKHICIRNAKIINGELLYVINDDLFL